MHTCFLCKHCAIVVENSDKEAHFKWKCPGLDTAIPTVKKMLFSRPAQVIVNKLSFGKEKDNHSI